MNLVEGLANLENARTSHGPRCTVEIILESVTPEEGKAIIETIDNPRIPASLIARTLTENGYRVAHRTITRHRRRGASDGCRCE